MKKKVSLSETFELAYAHFNKTLFDGKLPFCMILVHRKRGAGGYFWADQWVNSDTDKTSHEIAMNPDHFKDVGDERTLSILVHEMAHLEQQVSGKPGKGGYHNLEWVTLMERIGLVPYAVDGPKPEIVDGEFEKPTKQVGTRVSHIIKEGGLFEASCATLLATGLTIDWYAKPKSPAAQGRARAQKASKTKFTCPECKQNAWAKPDASLGCWECGVEMGDN